MESSKLIESLNLVEEKLKDALRETTSGLDAFAVNNKSHLVDALGSVQDAILELLSVK